MPAFPSSPSHHRCLLDVTVPRGRTVKKCDTGVWFMGGEWEEGERGMGEGRGESGLGRGMGGGRGRGYIAQSLPHIHLF